MKNIVQEMHQPGKLCTGFNSIGHRNPIIAEKPKGCNLMRVREFIRHKYVSIGCRIDNYPLTRRTIVAVQRMRPKENLIIIVRSFIRSSSMTTRNILCLLRSQTKLTIMHHDIAFFFACSCGGRRRENSQGGIALFQPQKVR